MVNFIRMLFFRLTLRTAMRSLNHITSLRFVIFSLLCFLIGFSVLKNEQQTNAQVTPIPPPVQQPAPTPLHLDPSQLKNDTSSPIVEVLTTSLIEGESVFKVKITDKSPINIAQITFIQNGQAVTESLVRDPNNVYKALIDVRLPSAVVIISAVDVHGKTAYLVKYLNVSPLSNSVLAQITNFFSSIGKSIVSIFGFANQ
jgi:hypothetical protein